MEDFNALIYKLMEKGVSINLFLKDNTIWYDLNTGMKSSLHITPHHGDIQYEGRYDSGVVVATWPAILMLAKQCLYGREYMSHAWQAILISENLLKLETTTKVITE